MKLHAALCFLVFVGCATSSQSTVKAVQGSESQPAEPLRLETPAGTFLVNPGQVEDFQKVLSGEPSTKPFYSADITE